MSAGLPEADYLALINDYIRQFPTSHEGYLRRATFYMDKKDDEHNKLAEADITRALEVSTRKDDAYYNACKLVYQPSPTGCNTPTGHSSEPCSSSRKPSSSAPCRSTCRHKATSTSA